MSRNIVYFDLETQKSLQQTGGRKQDLLVSLAVTYSTREQRYEIYEEDRMDELINELQRADLIVGHNIVEFDFAVLTPYSLLDLKQFPSLDTLLEIKKITGELIGLEAIAKASLGEAVVKTAGGLDALKWYQEGRMLEIAEYCCFDVKLSRLIHEFGVNNGCIYYIERNTKATKRVDVDWK